MIITNAQAGLLLKDYCVTKVAIKNDLIGFFGIDPEKSVFEIDYNIEDAHEVESDSKKSYSGILKLLIKLNVKLKRKIVFSLDYEMIGLLIAPHDSYESLEDFREAVQINGLTSLISIARANISTLTSNIFSEGCVRLPLINVFKVIQLKNEATN